VGVWVCPPLNWTQRHLWTHPHGYLDLIHDFNSSVQESSFSSAASAAGAHLSRQMARGAALDGVGAAEGRNAGVQGSTYSWSNLSTGDVHAVVAGAGTSSKPGGMRSVLVGAGFVGRGGTHTRSAAVTVSDAADGQADGRSKSGMCMHSQ
jgi:hypothetical protein